MKRGRIVVAASGFAVFAIAVVTASCEKMVPAGMGCSTDRDCTNLAFPTCSNSICVGPIDMSMEIRDLKPGPDLAPCVHASCPVTLPFCRDGFCAICMGDGDCNDHPGTPKCKAGGTCVQCLGPVDCAASLQTCNTDTNLCVACQKHGDCTSGICDGGMCILETNIVYVDGATCPAMNAMGTRSSPYCDVPAAVSNLGNRKHILVAPGDHDKVDVDGLVVTIVGTGTMTPWDPTVRPMSQLRGGTGSPGVKVRGMTSDVVIDGFDITASKIGVECSSDGKLTIRRSHIHDNNAGQIGVVANGCRSLTLDGNLVGPNNGGGGIKIDVSIYTITNNFIVGNVSNANPGVLFDANSTGAFRFNTVADNQYTGGNAGGINCANSGTNRAIEMSIVFGNSKDTNTMSQVSGSRCMLSSVVTGPDPFTGAIMDSPEFRMAGDYRLTAPSAMNSTCCIDKIPQAAGLTDHDIEFESRPFNMMWDIGADETR